MHAGGGDAGGYVGAVESPAGRWPANVLLTHHEDCELVGRKRVKGSNAPGMDRGSALGRMNDDGWQPKERKPGSFAGEDGTEEVGDWKCHPSCPVRMLDEQSGETRSSVRMPTGKDDRGVPGFVMRRKDSKARGIADRGGASRFFYCGKATRRERGEGNDHPTAKPVELMRYLVRLVTPAGGVVLDPFMGSGSTGLAALAEGRRFVGIDKEEKHVAIARTRLADASPLFARSA